jgi:hypothetical protein
MANLYTYTFDQMVADVKTEARNSGNVELDGFIESLINEILAHYTALNTYPQMLKKDAQLNLTLATEAIALPTDLQHLDGKNIRYFCANEVQQTPYFNGRQLQKYDKYRNAELGWTTQFIRQGNQLLLSPYDCIATEDYLLIDYWSMPVTLAVAQTPLCVFPIVELIEVIKKECIARVTNFDDPKQWQRYKAEAKEAYIASQAVLDT